MDDLTGKINSVVTIWEEGGKLYGGVERLVNPDPNDPDRGRFRYSTETGSAKFPQLGVIPQRWSHIPPSRVPLAGSSCFAISRTICASRRPLCNGNFTNAEYLGKLVT